MIKSFFILKILRINFKIKTRYKYNGFNFFISSIRKNANKQIQLKGGIYFNLITFKPTSNKATPANKETKMPKLGERQLLVKTISN